MNLAYHTKGSRQGLEQPISMMDFDSIEDMASLVTRFNDAHLRLNEVELALHDAIDGSERSELMHQLEDARGAYMDARFALNQKQAA
jgi:hypothetical protein